MSLEKLKLCEEKNTGYTGSDIRSLPDVKTVYDCFKACGEVTDCKSFTVLLNDTCWIKNSSFGEYVNVESPPPDHSSLNMDCVQYAGMYDIIIYKS